MKNITTLSLITVAILGVNGCGGGNSSSTKSSEVTSIQKLSDASQKHSKAEWNALKNEIQALDKTEKFNTVLLDSIQKNVANLTYVGIDKEKAYATNSDAMFDDLTDLDIGDLDNQVVAECNDDESCKEMAYVSLDNAFIIDKEMAYVMAEDFRGNEKSLVNDKLVKEFTCEAGLTRTVKHYGIEDVFNTTNGLEATQQNPASISQGMLDYNSNVNAGFANYDETHNNRLFLDNIDNLPSGITKGRFYIGLKSNGSNLQGNDTMSLGDMSQPVGTKRFSSRLTDLNTTHNWSNQLVNNSNPTTDIYWSDFSNITMGTQTFLDYIQTTNRFDAYVQDDTSVDFITVATCSKPDPIKEIETIVNKFECSEKETLVKILGGKIDAFALAEDATTPSAILVATNTLPKMKYDNPGHDKHFIDTLNLGLTSSQTVTNAQFHIGYKSTNHSLWTNDALYLGEQGVNHAAFTLYSNPNLLISNSWVTQPVNGETIASTNLDLNNTIGTGTVLSTMKSNGFLDVYLQDDTTVDFTQLNLCVKDNCSENAKNIELNLSKLASWTFKPSDAVENNVFNGTQYQGVWDDTINWFDFTNSHSDEMLEIPFCACGNTIVNINNLKADNSATVKLDGTLVASQTANDQAAMKRDDMGGVHEDGSVTVPAGTNGGTNHVLRVNVHNLGSEFGVAIDGTLKFKGNLGKCTK